MVNINEYLAIYIQAMFGITAIACVVELISYGIFKAFGLVNILR